MALPLRREIYRYQIQHIYPWHFFPWLSRWAGSHRQSKVCATVSSKRFWDIGCDVVGDFAATRICPIHIGRLRFGCNLGHTYEPNCICCGTFPVPTILFNCTKCLLRGAEQISPYQCTRLRQFSCRNGTTVLPELAFLRILWYFVNTIVI